MAKYLMMKFKSQLSLLLMQKILFLPTLITLIALQNVQAETNALIDPTQPPAAFLTNTPETEMIPKGPVLQSIMTGTGYHAAIINGQKVMLGQKYEGGTLVRLTTDQAVLRYPDKTMLTLSLDYPIEKNQPLSTIATPKVNEKTRRNPK